MACSAMRRMSTGVPYGTAAAPSEPLGVPQELKDKAEEKERIVREAIQNIEKALRRGSLEDRKWLLSIIGSDSQCFVTLIRIAISPKWEVFVRLRCVVLRAMQMMLRVAVTWVNGEHSQNPNHGMLLFREMAGADLAEEAYPHIVRTTLEHEETLLACDALLVLSELGKEALEPGSVHERVLDLMLEIPDRMDELAEVAMKIHRYGGHMRQSLLEAIMRHGGGKHLGEALIQIVNIANEEEKKERAAKVLTGCIAMPQGETFLFTNDALVLVDILFRELPKCTEEPDMFVVYAALLKAVYAKYPKTRDHFREQYLQVLEDIRDNEERTHAAVRGACAEVIGALNGGGLYSGMS